MSAPATPLTQGDSAPDFTLPRDTGEALSLSDQRGHPVVLFFYPKDNTPGCTTEALDFTAQLSAFQAAGAVVWGISKDSLRKHENFRKKHELRVELLSDAEAGVCETYGTWVEKKMYGKTFWGIERSTFVIDAQGQIAAAWRKVKVPGHVDEVLTAVQAL